MQFPLSIKTLIRIAIVLGVCAILWLGKSLLITLVLGGLLAIILNPVDNWLRGKGVNAGLSIGACILLLALFFGGVFAAVGSQAARFAENWPTIKERVTEKLDDLQGKLAQMGGAETERSTTSEEKDADTEANSGGSSISASRATAILRKTAGVLGNFLLLFVYVALFLSQKERLQQFILKRTKDDRREETKKTMREVREVAQQYLRGRLILIGILSVLYSIGFSVAGLDYAIIIALLAAVLSVIPYLGNIIGGLIALALAFTSGGGSEQLWGIVITMSVAQVLESYVLTPLIVGKEVSINPLATIVGVVGFNILWGPVGAVVAIPIVAMARILFTHLNGMKDYAFLLGDDS